MDTNLDDAISGLLLLHGDNDLNNDRSGSTTPTFHDSGATTTFNNSGLPPTSNDSMDVTPTSPAAVTKKQIYKKRGDTSFIQNRESKKSKCTYQATVKPRAAK
jgi:hypothetical protein